MASAWASVKSATNKAAAATKRAAKKMKLNSDINNCQYRIATLKQVQRAKRRRKEEQVPQVKMIWLFGSQEMGVAIYALMDSDDLQNVQSKFQETKALIKEQEETIGKLQAEVAALDAEAQAEAAH